jgi:hypothetical protein
MKEITGRDYKIIREALSIAIPIMLRHSLAASNTDDMIRILEEGYNGFPSLRSSNTRMIGDILLELKAGERPKADPRTDTMGSLIERFIKKIPQSEFDYHQSLSTPPYLREDIDIGLIGEIDVRRELAAEEWLTINTNTEKGNFPNVDLIAAKDQEARHIQVKSTSGDRLRNAHAHCLNFGHAQGWLEKRTPFFNGKRGILTSSIIVLVNVRRDRSRFVVLPVALAEKIARAHAEEWFDTPKRDGKRRSAGFSARPCFTRLKKDPTDLDKTLIAILHSYENRWDLLNESPEVLSNSDAWHLEVP